jgi:hypothetical protein
VVVKSTFREEVYSEDAKANGSALKEPLISDHRGR